MKKSRFVNFVVKSNRSLGRPPRYIRFKMVREAKRRLFWWVPNMFETAQYFTFNIIVVRKTNIHSQDWFLYFETPTNRFADVRRFNLVFRLSLRFVWKTWHFEISNSDLSPNVWHLKKILNINPMVVASNWFDLLTCVYKNYDIGVEIDA